MRNFGKILFALAVCEYFAFRYQYEPSFLKLSLYTSGRERTPYQYRVLPMYIFRGLIHLGETSRIASHFQSLGYDPYRLISFVVVFLSMAGALVATRLTIAKLTGDSAYALWAALMVALMADIQLASPGSFTLPYDVPSLFLFALGIYFVVCRRLWAYYALLPLAVMNRETACFISAFFVIWEWVRLSAEGAGVKARISWIMPHALAQAMLWLAIKAYLWRAYAQNPTELGAAAGGLFVTAFHYNIREILKPQQWPVLLSVCGFSLPFLYIQRRWIRCDGLSFGCAIILPIHFATMMFAGIVVELRVFTEWIALVTPALALIIHNRLRLAHGPKADDGAAVPHTPLNCPKFFIG